MKPLPTQKKTLISKRGVLLLILFFLVGKLALIGSFLVKTGKFSSPPFLTQAVAQEEAVDTKEAEETTAEATSGEELKTLTLLEKKKKEVETKEQELRQREERLNQLKAEIEERLTTLAQMEKKIEQLIALKEAEEDKELIKLAKVFEATPPEQAGPMFNKLDVDIAVKILLRMKGKNAGKIWGFVDPDKAVIISKELAKLK
jgi:flagellar motility protein MotE (MotC chaperone)